jgi:DNA-binding transcriptional regulator YhcF (GntR family)
MGFAFAIDHNSAVPPFEQLRSQVVEAAASGALAAGSRLPTVRALSRELGLATNTVARSYRELEAQGVIETRGRAGSFIAAGHSPRQRAELAAAEYAATVSALGLDAATALQIAKRALAAVLGPHS